MIFCQIDDKLVEIIKKYADGRVIIDCGCGEALLSEFFEHGEIINVDLFAYRYECDPTKMIVPMDICAFPFRDNHFPVFIRPCHSYMFVGRCLDINRRKKAFKDCFYISMPHNLEKDIDMDMFKARTVHGWEGQEGEKIYRIVF